MTIPFQRQHLRKYFIMGSQDCGNRSPLTVLEAALQAGITAFQFREKGTGALTGEEKEILGAKLRARCASYQVPFIVNDDVGLMEVLEADGVHVGQDDSSVKMIRERFPNIIIGLSISSRHELTNSPVHLIDYIGAGTVFRTTSKADAEVTGLQWIKTLRCLQPAMPITGIGGITVENSSAVIEAGADGVSVISAVTQASNIQRAVKML
ncbi:MAG TPA: thiamine phosphate synthase [Virgibacillus sp.]|nr:thiamine phosphate synthase [Virgibacillus sp.]